MSSTILSKPLCLLFPVKYVPAIGTSLSPSGIHQTWPRNLATRLGATTPKMSQRLLKGTAPNARMRSGFAAVSSERRNLAQCFTAFVEGAWSLSFPGWSFFGLADGHLTAGVKNSWRSRN